MRTLIVLYSLISAEMIYLIIDFIRDEVKKRRERDRELEDWNE